MEAALISAVVTTIGIRNYRPENLAGGGSFGSRWVDAEEVKALLAKIDQPTRQ